MTPWHKKRGKTSYSYERKKDYKTPHWFWEPMDKCFVFGTRGAWGEGKSKGKALIIHREIKKITAQAWNQWDLIPVNPIKSERRRRSYCYSRNYHNEEFRRGHYY